MTKSLTIIALFFWTLAYGQVSKKDAYKNIDGLTIVDSITYKAIGDGFSISNGFCSNNFRLSSNMTFQEIDHCCMANFLADSGSWTIKNHNTVVLKKSNKKTLYFDIVKFDNFYFFIEPSQRQIFIADLKTTRIKFKDFEPITIEEKIISAKTMIGMSLGENYYSKEIDDITGT